MKYLKLVAPLFDIGKGNEFKVDKESGEKLLRDVVVENLWSIITSEKNKQDDSKRDVKRVSSVEEMRNVEKLKERLVYSTTDIVEMGNDLFKFLQDSFEIDNMPVTVSKIIVELDRLIEECDKQDEEVAEKEFKAQDKIGTTIKKFYEDLGVKVVVNKPEAPLSPPVKPNAKK
jgi:hypothetical protein